VDALRVEELTRAFGGVIAVNRVSLRVRPGERRAIIGPNGAGKTTFFNLLSGNLAPTTGRIFLDDRDITTLPTHERVRLGLGRTFQQSSLFPSLSVRENIRLAIQARHRVAHRPFSSAERVPEVEHAIDETLERFGFSDQAADVVRELSYGEQRQLEIALAVATRPRVLLLDEPTAGMSPAETVVMSRLIRSLPADTTVLIIEHDMDVVFDLAERITVLHHGEVLADGTAPEVRADPRVMEVYLGIEAGGT